MKRFWFDYRRATYPSRVERQVKSKHKELTKRTDICPVLGKTGALISSRGLL
jgi:hypothetical protein